MNDNKDSTRYYSDMQEKAVCKALGAKQQPNSGASHFNKGDCVNSNASLLIECKTVMSEKQSVSIREDWITKNNDECFAQRLSNGCIAFNFKPGGQNYYVISEKLMKYLVEHLEEDND